MRASEGVQKAFWWSWVGKGGGRGVLCPCGYLSGRFALVGHSRVLLVVPWWVLPGCSLAVQACAHGCPWVCIRVQAYALMRAHMRPYVRSHIRAHAGACGHTGAGMRTCVQGRGPPGVLPPIACTLLKTHPLFKKIPYFRPFFLGWPGSCNINYSYIEYY